MDELLSYRCENVRAVGEIMMDVAEAEVTDVIEMNVILALQARKNTHRMKRALLLIMLVVTAAGKKGHGFGRGAYGGGHS
jgi:hypothetical protein